MAAETIATQLRLLGQTQYTRGMDAAAAATHRLEASTRTLGSTGAQLDRLGSSLWTFAKRGAVGVGALGVAAGVTGLKYNAMIEDAQIANSVFLGNERAGKRLTRQLVLLDKATPTLGLDDLLQGSRYLVNAGFTAQRTTSTMGKLGDAISIIGNKQGELNRITYALGQIGSGVAVQTDEFRQLADTGITSFKRMGKQFGMSGGEFKDAMAEGKIGTEDFFKAFDRDLQRFEGGAAKASKSFSGQVATMGTQWKTTMGTLSKPLSDHLKSHVFPALTTFGTEWSKVLDNNRLTTEQKWEATTRLFEAYLKPQLAQFGTWIEEADVPGKIVTGLDAALPVMMDKFADMAPRVAASFINAWLAADAWTKLLTAGVLAAKFGVFSKVGSLVVGPFLTGFGTGLGGKKAQAKLGRLGGSMGRVMGRAAGPAALAAMGAVFVEKGPQWSADIAEFFGEDPKKTKRSWGDIINPDFWKDIPANIWDEVPLRRLFGHKPKRKRQFGGPVVARREYLVGEQGPELFVPHLSGNIIPNNLAMPSLALPSGEAQIIVPVHLDGKVITKVVAKHTSDAQARKGPHNFPRPAYGR